MTAHPIVHIEFSAKDPQAASTFYAEAFGWQVQTDPHYNYHMFQAEGGPGGGFVQADTPADGGTMRYKPGEVLVYIGSDDIDADLRKVQALGGEVVVTKTEIPQVGWFGVFRDPTGNKVALFTGTTGQG